MGYTLDVVCGKLYQLIVFSFTGFSVDVVVTLKVVVGVGVFR